MQLSSNCEVDDYASDSVLSLFNECSPGSCHLLLDVAN